MVPRLYATETNVLNTADLDDSYQNAELRPGPCHRYAISPLITALQGGSGLLFSRRQNVGIASSSLNL